MIDPMNSSLAGTIVSLWKRGDSSLFGTLWVLAACLATLTILLLPGCSDPSRAHAGDVPPARDRLKIALHEWKKGESPKSLASSSTPVIVQDFERASGTKPVNYELLDDGKAEDANLRVQTKLSLIGGRGPTKTIDKKVW
jgi:hypothetical protein